MQLGNPAYAAGDLPLAVNSFRHATEVRFESAVARGKSQIAQTLVEIRQQKK
jgi:hypothetical protein